MMLLLSGRTSCFYLVFSAWQYLLSQRLYCTPMPALPLQELEYTQLEGSVATGGTFWQGMKLPQQAVNSPKQDGLTKQCPFHLPWERGTEGAVQGRGASQPCRGFSGQSRRRGGAFPAGKRCCFPGSGTVLRGRPTHYKPTFYCSHCTEKHWVVTLRKQWGRSVTPGNKGSSHIYMIKKVPKNLMQILFIHTLYK